MHPIEVRSYEIMESELDFSAWAPEQGELVKRMVHATADESFATTALVGERAPGALVEALRSGAAVICDSNMVVAGVPAVATAIEVRCYLSEVRSQHATTGETTRSAAAIDLAAGEHPSGSVWVFGNAPTALSRLLELHASGAADPAAVIGLPVGYVGAAEAKSALWASSLRPVSVTNTGRRGGSAAACAVLNAAWRLANS